MTEERYLSIPEFAKVLNVHPVTVRRWIKDERHPLPVFRLPTRGKRDIVRVPLKQGLAHLGIRA